MDIDIKPIIKAARAGGEIIISYFGKILDIEVKTNASDFRTKADIESEKAIINVLQKAFPYFSIYSEEIGKIDKNTEYCFVIDPLDGSNNFVLGIADFTVSIALMKNDQTIIGVIYNPITNQTYTAKTGQGAYLDSTKIQVNTEHNIKQATISYTCGYDNPYKYFETINQRLHKLHIKRLITFWSPAYEYCLLASGKIEAIINIKNELYDYAAGKLIVREAGGKITDFSNKPDLI